METSPAGDHIHTINLKHVNILNYNGFQPMNTTRITLRDWTRYPGGRAKEDGEHSGQEFREHFLDSHVKAGDSFEIDFNGIFTAGWSFLDEALGHYVTELGESEFRKRFLIIADDDPDILEEIETVIEKRTSK